MNAGADVDGAELGFFEFPDAQTEVHEVLIRTFGEHIAARRGNGDVFAVKSVREFGRYVIFGAEPVVFVGEFQP